MRIYALESTRKPMLEAQRLTQIADISRPRQGKYALPASGGHLVAQKRRIISHSLR